MTPELIGWLGAFLLATCGLPQAWKTYRTKKCEDLSWVFILFWFGGEVLTLTYIILNNLKVGNFQPPLYFNYGLNIAILFYLIYAKMRYKQSNKSNSLNI
jgi:uncharacterized protein with PQ loop repeat